MKLPSELFGEHKCINIIVLTLNIVHIIIWINSKKIILKHPVSRFSWLSWTVKENGGRWRMRYLLSQYFRGCDCLGHRERKSIRFGSFWWRRCTRKNNVAGLAGKESSYVVWEIHSSRVQHARLAKVRSFQQEEVFHH